MIINLLLAPARDYTATLRRRCWLLAGCGALGALMLLLSHYAFPRDAGHAQEFVRGFYSGAGTGMVIVAIVFLIHTFWLLRRPDKRRAAQIRETDERQRHIAMRTFYTASSICMGLTVVAMLVAAPLNFTVFLTLLVEFFQSTAVVMVVHTVYQKTL